MWPESASGSAQADHRGGEASRRRRPLAAAASRRAGPNTMPSRWIAASPTTSTSNNGPTRSGTSARAWQRKSRCRTSARTSSSRSTTRRDSWRSRYNVYRCWVSEYQALPDLDANANAVAIQHIKLENEGWERDQSVQEPTEPTFSNPGGIVDHARAFGTGVVGSLGGWLGSRSGGARSDAPRGCLPGNASGRTSCSVDRPARRCLINVPRVHLRPSHVEPDRMSTMRQAGGVILRRLLRAGSSRSWSQLRRCSLEWQVTICKFDHPIALMSQQLPPSP